MKETAKTEDEESEFMLSRRPLRKPYAYVKDKKSVTSVRRNPGGDLVARSIVGKEEDFKQVEASKFLAKLNNITLGYDSL